MGEVIRETIKHTWNSSIWLKFLTITAVLLIITSFFIPPVAQIHPSILSAVAELEILGALWIVYHAIDKGMNAKLTKGNVNIELNNMDN